MNLYIKRYDDYRTGIDIIVVDKENLEEEYLSEFSEYENSDDLDVKLMTDEKFNEKLDMDENIYDIITLNNEFKDTYTVYLIYGEGYHNPEETKVIDIINQPNKNDATNIMKHLYSDINNHQPFVQTSDDYKPQGYYPEALPKFFIDRYPSINDLIEIISDDRPDYCVSVTIYNNKLIDYLQISNH